MSRGPLARRGLAGVAVVAGGVLALLTWGPLSASEAPSTELSVATVGGSAGASQSSTYGVDSILGQPDAQALQGAGVAATPGPIAAELTVTNACPGLNGLVVYQGCPAGVRSTTTLKVTDQRVTPTACGAQRTCTVAEAGARVKVYDRSKLDGLTIAKRDGGTVKLTKNPDGSLYDDIFESAPAYDAAKAANYGCNTDVNGTCTAGVRQPGDLLVLVRFPDGTKTIYVGRSLSAASFVDSDGNGTPDLDTESIQVQKQIDKTGVITYIGGKSSAISVV